MKYERYRWTRDDYKPLLFTALVLGAGALLLHLFPSLGEAGFDEDEDRRREEDDDDDRRRQEDESQRREEEEG